MPIQIVSFGNFPNMKKGSFCTTKFSTFKKNLFTIVCIKFKFLTDQDIIKVSAQKCAKTKGPLIEVDQINFEVHI